MEQYDITGMSCAACSARVEKAVTKLPGVESCAVSLLTNSMGVEGSADESDIIAAVQAAGYGASKKGKHKANTEKESEDTLSDWNTPLLKRRFAVSLAFLLVLMYFSMGHMLLRLSMPLFLQNNPVAMGLVQLLLTGIILVINQNFFISGYKALWHRAPNMDTLVALGATAAFCYSTYALFAMTFVYKQGDSSAVMEYYHDFYFESAAMIVTLITLGKLLEAHSKGKTTNALKSLLQLAPKNAVVEKDGIEIKVPIEDLKVRDVFVVRPGESIPADGVIISGESAINEASLTGESIPVDRRMGDNVSAATINQSGFIRCKAAKVGEDTTLSQIIKMVTDAAATKAPIAKIADKVSGIFVPTVIAIAAVTIAAWMLMGETAGFALARGISVLVISCPCALGLATPVAIMVASGMGAKSGILFKTALSLEQTGKVAVVALDKTGTITSGNPAVTDILAEETTSKEHLLQIAYALENKSEHPLSRAIVQYAQEQNSLPEETENFTVIPGSGLSATMHNRQIIGGNLLFVQKYCKVSKTMQEKAQQLSDHGKTPLFFCENDVLLGIIAVADTIKTEARTAVQQLKEMGLHVVMLTGDNQRTANAIGKQADVDEVIAEVLPDGKESVIRSLQDKDKVVMVGDGINDAPALTRADVGIAIGSGADVAVDSADIVLMKSKLTDVPAAIRLSRATVRNIHENLFWAFIYNVVGIPLAAGVFISLFGWKLNPMFGAAAMSLSSFCVVTNALRLNIYKFQKENIVNKENKENKDQLQRRESKMDKTIRIEGMMCAHCEMTVKKALEEIDGVSEALVSHENGTAVVTMVQEISDETLHKAVEDKGYQVLH